MKLKDILFYLCLTLICAICLRIIQRVINKRTTEEKAEKIMRYICCICFILYLLNVFNLTFFSRFDRPREFILDPFHKLKSAIAIHDHIIFIYYKQLYESILNVIMLIPFGYFIPLVWKKWKRKGFFVVFFGFLFSAGIEVMQYITYRGTAETVDVMNNTIGCFIGYLVYWFIFQRKSVKNV